MSGTYWDVPWNPMRGCCPVSAGCANCWASAQASRFAVPAWKGLAEGGKWTGETRFDAETLAKPLRWRKPRVVATCWMGDLFYENVTDEEIAAVFGVMAACPQHTFLVLTKRAERMRGWFRLIEDAGVEEGAAGRCFMLADDRLRSSLLPLPRQWTWPLHNVWIGASVEDQASADGRVPHLLASPAAVRWVSYEPALGAVDFANIGATTSEGMWRLDALHREGRNEPTMGPRLDWIVVGGESAQGGKGARPCDVEWIRDMVRQCKAAGVLAYVKQIHDERGRLVTEPADFPADLRIRELPEGTP